LEQAAKAGRAAAGHVLTMRKQPERLMATVKVSVVLLAMVTAALATLRLPGPLQPLAQAVGVQPERVADVALGTVLVGVVLTWLVLGELVPRSLALRHADALALWVCTPLRLALWVSRPVVWLVISITNLLLRPLGDQTTFTESRVNAEELRVLIEEASRTGVVDPRSGDIAGRALDFARLTAGEVAVPRARLQTVDVHSTPEDVRRTFMEEGHHRMPVVDGTPDQVLGYVTAKDVLTMHWQGPLIVLQDIIRPVLFVPETTSAPNLLKILQEKRQRLAVVVDELGGTKGLVTLEDLFEELVGDFYGEEEAVPEFIKEVAPGRFLVAGMTPLRDLERAAGLRIPDDVSAETVAGLVLTLAGEIPAPGASYAAHGATWKVVSRTERRVKQVEVSTSALEGGDVVSAPGGPQPPPG
jgi:putative hemolysin